MFSMYLFDFIFLFSIFVLDAPEIEVERPFVHTGVGYEAQLICIVHAGTRFLFSI